MTLLAQTIIQDSLVILCQGVQLGQTKDYFTHTNLSTFESRIYKHGCTSMPSTQTQKTRV